jgi:predicted amidohydrolase
MKMFFAKYFLNPWDLEFNYNKIIKIYDEAFKKKCDILVFGELALTGMPIAPITRENIHSNNTYLEKIVNYTKGKKTKILIGCIQYIPSYTNEEAIKKEQTFNSVALINDGYIKQTTNKTTFVKTNIFNEYRYFDLDNSIKDIKNDADSYGVLIGDDILENKNIFYLKDRDNEFAICLDTSIVPPEQQLKKIAKWSRKGVIYLNIFTYNNNHKFKGEFYIVDGNGDFIYKNIILNETLIELDIKYIKGESDIYVKETTLKECEFVNILAKNNPNKTIIFESDKKINTENNVKIINFNKQTEGIDFIDIKEYFKFTPNLTDEIKKIVVNERYKNENIVFLK